jgi:hypothetical protein
VRKTLHLVRALITSSLLCIPSLCPAWEFNIESALLSFRYVYASQAGSNGFFGPFNTDNGSKTQGDLAPLNGWFQRKMISGTTAETSFSRFSIFPALKLNKAVEIRGTYRIASDITNDIAAIQDPDLENVISYGRWTRLWVTVDTPLGKLYYGRRGFQQGLGLQFSSADTAEEIFESGRRTVEIFQLESYWGPFTIGAGFYPWRLGSKNYKNSQGYWNIDDQNAARTTHLLGYLRYAAGTIDTGLGGFYFAFHEGPESKQSVSARKSYSPRYTNATEGWLYLKYNNGRLFFNTEADWYYRTIKYQTAQDGSFPGPDYDMDPILDDLPPYIESWRYMAEFGAYSGPAKASFLLAHMPGPDRRHGILIDKQPYIQDPERSAYAVFYPYGVLMGKYYLAGVNSYRDMSASDVAAVRLDYMVASNLDVMASITKAYRSSDGYGLGFVKPDTTYDKLLSIYTRFGYLAFNQPGSYADPAPAIPDRDLGWEFNAGIVWKLLENWRLYARGAYWQPGKWFNYACVDKSVPGWDVPASTNNFGTNPNRTIAPIFGFELYLDARL